jgi:hypothetical protein
VALDLYHDQQPRAVVVSQAVIVDVVQALFEALWGAAIPIGVATRMHSVLGDGVKLQIVRHLMDGDKDETIARRLGISLRTCRRYVAEILSAADAASRFQAGFRIALGPDRPTRQVPAG